MMLNVKKQKENDVSHDNSWQRHGLLTIRPKSLEMRRVMLKLNHKKRPLGRYLLKPSLRMKETMLCQPEEARPVAEGSNVVDYPQEARPVAVVENEGNDVVDYPTEARPVAEVKNEGSTVVAPPTEARPVPVVEHEGNNIVTPPQEARLVDDPHELPR